MRDFEAQDGVAFLLIYYTGRDQLYYLRFCDLIRFWERAQKGGRKSFRFDELDPDYILPKHRSLMVPYLDMISRDLDTRDG